jgi:hypothetical protein
MRWIKWLVVLRKLPSLRRELRSDTWQAGRQAGCFDESTMHEDGAMFVESD